MPNKLHKKYRPLFKIPKGMVYLDGNSLGPPLKQAKKTAQNVIANEWGEKLVKGWNTCGWMTKPDKIGNMIAGLIGAEKNTVSVGDTLSIKLFQALEAALQVAKKMVWFLPKNITSHLTYI